MTDPWTQQNSSGPEHQVSFPQVSAEAWDRAGRPGIRTAVEQNDALCDEW